MAEKVLDKTKLQTCGKNLWNVFSDAIGSESYLKYQQAIDSNKAVHFEDYYPPLKKWYEVSAYPSANVLSVYFKDITQRKKTLSALEESERNYSGLFHLSPLPMWVFDLETLRFLDVNEAALRGYGYSLSEFLAMTIKEIRPQEDWQRLDEILATENTVGQKLVGQGIFRHKKKDGKLIQVDIQSNLIRYQGKQAKIVIASDMTERFDYTHAIERQNIKLREIAWIQSHVVRAPLARIMGIIPMIRDIDTYVEERVIMLEYLLIAANELDDAIKNISDRTQYHRRQ
jgi:PAS domain S-box-containing protein